MGACNNGSLTDEALDVPRADEVHVDDDATPQSDPVFAQVGSVHFAVEQGPQEPDSTVVAVLPR